MESTQVTRKIEDLRVLEVLNNSMRLRLLYQLHEPRTIRELSESLEVPVTRLYHHVNLLESVGVIEVVETRKSGARLQRVYRATATCFEAGEGLLENVEDKQRIAEVVAGAVLDGARLDAVSGLLKHFEEKATSTSDETAGTLGRTMVALSAEGARQFADRLKDLIEEMSALEDRDGEEYALTFVFFPMVGPVKGGRL